MGDTDGPAPGPPTLSDWEVDRLAEHLDRLLADLLSRGDDEIAAAVVGLVEGIERIHAEGMRRLAELLARDTDLLARAERDPVISSLFTVYDLSVGERSGAEEGRAALDPGGVSPTGDTSIVPQSTLVHLRRRLEERRSGTNRRPDGPLPGGLDSRDPDAREDRGAHRMGTVPLSDLPEGGLYGVTVGRMSVLLVRHPGGSVHAFRNACPGTPLPLHLGSFDDDALVCPWHGCRFDPSSGTRLDQEGPPLRPLAVHEHEGTLHIALP